MGEAPDAIRQDIEETRARMGERAEALAYKADVPARSKDKVHDVTDSIKEKVSAVTDKVTGKGHEVAGTLSDKAQGMSNRASDVGGDMSDKAHGAGDSVVGGAQRAKSLAESNPLGLAIGSIAAGFLAGLMIPATKVEREHLGPIAEQARDKAREITDQVQDKAKDAAQAAESAAKEQVSS